MTTTTCMPNCRSHNLVYFSLILTSTNETDAIGEAGFAYPTVASEFTKVKKLLDRIPDTQA